MFNIFKKTKKLTHRHNWVLYACNDKYHTQWTDGTTEHWNQRFYQCSCGERKHTDNRPSYHKDGHKGIIKAKQNWIDAGVVPDNSYFPDEGTGYVKPPSQEHQALDPVLKYQRTLDELVKSLGVVINRDFDLEAKYPELKKAADEYHRRLRKYRTAEILKGESNDV